MKNIKVIVDKDFNQEAMALNIPEIRIASRGIIFNDKNKIAILNKKNKNEYKLIGGGVEGDEDFRVAFEREAMEEAGCKIMIDDFIGTMREERTHHNFIQISYVYTAHVIEDTKKLNLTKKEIDEGGQLLWLDLDEAINIIRECENKIKPSQYEDVYATRFIVRRDYSILEYYKNHYLK